MYLWFFSHFTCYLFHKIKTPRKSLIETKKSYESQDNSSIIEPEGITSETLMMSMHLKSIPACLPMTLIS